MYAVQETQPGPVWADVYCHREAGYREWFLREGDAARPPYLAGCSQAVWCGDAPLLVRNYDYHPLLWDGVQLASEWSGKRIVGMIDSLWGMLDGMNDDGLAVSLSFGGRQVVGEGFGMPLILCYVLETWSDVPEGVAALLRIPSHMSYNVTLLDRLGNCQTVFVAPDRQPAVTNRLLATNHQRVVAWEAFAHATASLDRERYLRARLSDPNESAERFVDRFLEAPLHQTAFARGWGTLYTSVYRPQSLEITLRWTGYSLKQSIHQFQDAAVALSAASLAENRQHYEPHRHQPHDRRDDRDVSRTFGTGTAHRDQRRA